MAELSAVGSDNTEALCRGRREGEKEREFSLGLSCPEQEWRVVKIPGDAFRICGIGELSCYEGFALI